MSIKTVSFFVVYVIHHKSDLIIITPYNVLAADCLPVQIGDNYEK